jgi:hypothetical protein
LDCFQGTVDVLHGIENTDAEADGADAGRTDDFMGQWRTMDTASDSYLIFFIQFTANLIAVFPFDCDG